MPFRNPVTACLTPQSLHVAYRESPETQVIRVEVQVDKVTDRINGFRGWIAAMRGGCAAIDVARAGASGVKVLSGPVLKGDAGFESERYAWDLEITAVASKFLHVGVSFLSLIGGLQARPTAVSIVGSLPLDDSPASCRTADVLRWLDDSDSAAMTAIGELPFAATVKTAASAKAARFRFTGASAFTKEQFAELQAEWLVAWAGPLGIGHNLAGDGPADVQAAKLAHAGVEISAKFAKLDVRRTHAEGMLMNMLSKFHATVAPLAQVEVVLA